ncbi:MAG TPA: M1 family metallopeptidase, partial [Opitutaceae bacterium]
MHFLRLAVLAATAFGTVLGQPYATKPLQPDKFRQLEELLPTPGEQRTASGAPGHAYWQQRADYVIDATLDDATQSLTGRASITYRNASPDALTYLWLQLDPNHFEHNADARTTEAAPDFKKFSYQELQTLLYEEAYASDLKISAVTDAAGAPLPHTIVKTMMRVDLPQPLAPGATLTFSVGWSYKLNDKKGGSGRTGFEQFKDGHRLYVVAQWYPRMAVYGDTTGWQHKQYLGRGEFTLEFGNYEVNLTVPADHIVAGSGALQNPEQVLTAPQRERLRDAATAKSPVFIVTPDEARAMIAARATTKQKTWRFRAENVRDFAFASSRRFIWDAMGAPNHAYPPSTDAAASDLPATPVMAMSFYPPEGMPLWDKYSTHAIVHTLDVYSKYSFPYPYPCAISVNGPVGGGMEYPGICFNRPRPEPDGTYTARQKYGLISVVIHEVGHNYFPMIVNSDERQWTWMDEGLNSFLQVIAEQAWEKDYPSRRGEPRDIADYMTSANQVPIMTNSESIAQFGANAYAKPATALNILRETVLGRELFDHAFQTYARRWAFKRPYPADFFRTMEDATGVDLDWFWRGWFYTIDHVDLSIENVRLYTLDTRDPEIERARDRAEKKDKPVTLAAQRNAGLPKRVDAFPELKDFYNSFDEFTVLPSDREKFKKLVAELEQEEIDPALLRTERRFYAVELANLGGLVMPVIFKV